MEESTLRYNDIVPGTVLTVGVWPYNGWPELVTAAASGNTYMVRVTLMHHRHVRLPTWSELILTTSQPLVC